MSLIKFLFQNTCSMSKKGIGFLYPSCVWGRGYPPWGEETLRTLRNRFLLTYGKYICLFSGIDDNVYSDIHICAFFFSMFWLIPFWPTEGYFRRLPCLEYSLFHKTLPKSRAGIFRRLKHIQNTKKCVLFLVFKKNETQKSYLTFLIA